MSKKFSVHLLPHSYPEQKTWDTLVQHQKALRLESLQQCPEAFTSTYDREVAFASQDWENRLQNPLAFTFIAVESEETNARHMDADINTLADGNWIGNAVLFGPMSEFPNTSPKQQPTEEAGEEPLEQPDLQLEYAIFGVFVLPHARGLGIGKALIEHVVAHGKILAREKGAKEVGIQISGVVDNVRALALYERLGFSVVNGGSSNVSAEQRDTVTLEMRCVV